MFVIRRVPIYVTILKAAGCPIYSKNLFSTSKLLKNDDKVETTPWYLHPEESPSVNSPLNEVVLPELPDSSPHTLKNIVEFSGLELGFTDLEIFDVRNISGDVNINEGASDLAKFMVIGTGKSPKHLQKASNELNYFIKQKYHKLTSTEGILKSGALARYHRRLQRKGKKAPSYSQNDYGASPNTWIMTDCKTDGIFVHFLTRERRRDLNLEQLWSSDKAKYEFNKTSRKSDDIFSGIRYFHTAAERRSRFDPFNITTENYYNEFRTLCVNHIANFEKTPLSALKDHLEKMQFSGLQVTVPVLKEYYETLLQSAEFHLSLEKPNDVFQKRYNEIKNTLKYFQPSISKDELISLTPLLLATGSQFDNTKFSAPSNLKPVSESISYSPQIKSIARLLTKMTSSSAKTNDQQFLNITLLTIYSNAKDWNSFTNVVLNSIQTNDIKILEIAVILLSHLGDAKACAKFKEDYLPLLLEYNGQTNEYIDEVIRKSNM